MWISGTVWIDFMLSNPFFVRVSHKSCWRKFDLLKKMHSLVSKSAFHRTELHLPHYLMAIACEKRGKSRVLGRSYHIQLQFP
jgi:hypothetical protein